MKELYLDANASYGLLPEVQGALQETLQGQVPANPSAVHQTGQHARALLEDARESVKALVGAGKHDRVIFTSGATEANNLAFDAVTQADPEWGTQGYLLTTAIEHPSVLETHHHLQQLHGVEACGLVDYPGHGESWESELGKSLDSIPAGRQLRLFSAMIANNETGEILPIAALSDSVKQWSTQRGAEALVHCDAVQAAGKLPISMADLGVDLLTLSGHKLGALTGIGALVVKDESFKDAFPSLRGGPQESRWRAGTENVLGAYSMGIAARTVQSSLKKRARAMEQNVSVLTETLKRELPELKLVAESHPRLPNTLMVHLPGCRADDLVVALDLRGIRVSSGSACASGKQLPSHVLLAMGLDENEARECIRISLRADCEQTALLETLVPALVSLGAE